MNGARTSALLLLALTVCEPPASSPREEPPRGVLRQALPQTPPGVIGLAPTANATGDKFGHALVWGDFNGDFMPDLAVGAPGTASAEGRVHVYYGPIDPLTADVLASPLVTGNTGASFGSTLAAGDLNGDGVDELAVGAPGWATVDGGLTGLVVVYTGQRGSPLGFMQQGLDPTLLGLGARPRFGAALATNGALLWVGAPGAGDAGSVVVYTSTATLLSPSLTLHGASGFGSALLPMDIDGTNKIDLLVGSPLANSGKGGVLPFLSNNTGGYDAGVGTLTGSAQAERFGAALLQYRGAVVVGAPAGNTGGGRVQVSSVSPFGALTQLVSFPGTGAGGLGSSLAATDLSGDMLPELYAGAPEANAVRRFSGMPPAVDGELTGDGGRFGCALAGGVNAIGDSAQDLAVGAEDFVEPLGQILGGAVFIFAGDAGTPTTSTDAGAPVDAGIPSLPDGGVLRVQINVITQSNDIVTVRPVQFAATPPNARFEWDFGDMTPLQVTTTPVEQSHRYTAPGGYRVRLKLSSNDGVTPGTDDVQVKVADRLGHQPPDAVIKVLSQTGTGAQQTAKLECATSEPSAPAQWDLGSGMLVTQNPVTAVIEAGSTRVHCYVQGANGLIAHDSVLLRHNALAPLQCRLAFTPASGSLPLPVVHSGDVPAPQRARATVTLDDSTVIALDGLHEYVTAGFHPALLDASLTGGTARCTDRATVFTWKPLGLVTKPQPMKCGDALNFAVDAPGADSIQLVSGSAGVTYDSDTFTVSGPRVLKSQKVGFQLKLTNRFEEVTEDLSLEVQCDDDLGSFRTCGCSSGGAGTLLLLLVAFFRRRRR